MTLLMNYYAFFGSPIQPIVPVRTEPPNLSGSVQVKNRYENQWDVLASNRLGVVRVGSDTQDLLTIQSNLDTKDTPALAEGLATLASIIIVH